MKAKTCPTCGGSGKIEVVGKSEAEELFNKIAAVLQTPRTKPTTGRLNKLKTRLKTFTADEIYQAAETLSKSPWHMGDNPNNTKYASVDFLIRSDEKVDEWLLKSNIIPSEEQPKAFRFA